MYEVILMYVLTHNTETHETFTIIITIRFSNAVLCRMRWTGPSHLQATHKNM